jgi:hypothetical protein
VQSLFVPVVFLIGNLMSLVVPSASSLAIILMSILYQIIAKLDALGTTSDIKFPIKKTTGTNNDLRLIFINGVLDYLIFS